MSKIQKETESTTTVSSTTTVTTPTRVSTMSSTTTVSKPSSAPTDLSELSRPEIAKLLAVIGFLGLAGYYLGYRINHPPPGAPNFDIVDIKKLTTTEIEVCGKPARSGWPVVVRMVYSQDKHEWLKDAANRFATRCPNIQIKLVPVSGMDLVETAMSMDPRPTIASPPHEILLSVLDASWKDKSSDALYHPEDAQSLVRSPLIALVWDDTLQVLTRILDATDYQGEGDWTRTICPLVPRVETEPRAIQDMVPGTWIDWYTSAIPPAAAEQKPAPIRPTRDKVKTKPAYRLPFPSLEEIRSWGRVKYLHTAPTRSSAGLETLYLMAYDFVLPPHERSTLGAPQTRDASGDAGAPRLEEGWVVRDDHLREPFRKAFEERKGELQSFIRRCEAGVEDPADSVEQLTALMFSVGALNYDGVLTYEHLVFPLLQSIDEHKSDLNDLKVVYPSPTIMNDHPAVLLWPDDPERQEEIEAGRKWITFLRTEEMQRSAIEHGFRPSIPEVTIRLHAGKNPFLALRRYGVSFEEPLHEPPMLSGKEIQQLILLWQDATGRN